MSERREEGISNGFASVALNAIGRCHKCMIRARSAYLFCRRLAAREHRPDFEMVYGVWKMFFQSLLTAVGPEWLIRETTRRYNYWVQLWGSSQPNSWVAVPSPTRMRHVAKECCRWLRVAKVRIWEPKTEDAISSSPYRSSVLLSRTGSYLSSVMHLSCADSEFSTASNADRWKRSMLVTPYCHSRSWRRIHGTSLSKPSILSNPFSAAAILYVFDCHYLFEVNFLVSTTHARISCL